MANLNIGIKVDSQQAIDLMTAVRNAVSGQSLEQFLLGPTEDYLVDRIKERFQNEGDGTSGKWAPLAEWTVREREALGFPGEHPILYRTGGLHAFLTRRSNVTMVQGDLATLVFPGAGSTLEEQKLRVAQQGLSPNTKRGAGPVPARPVAVVDGSDALALGRSFTTWLETAIHSAGLAASFSVRAF